MDPNSKEFQKLNAIWRKKLADSGFDDIEDDQARMRPAQDIFRNRPDVAWIQSKVEYYRAAGQFLHHHPFENPTDKLIWRLHSEGVGVREIAAVLKSAGIKKKKKDIVHQTIKRLVKLMVQNVD